jgi:hypothetical protein
LSGEIRSTYNKMLIESTDCCEQETGEKKIKNSSS